MINPWLQSYCHNLVDQPLIVLIVTVVIWILVRSLFFLNSRNRNIPSLPPGPAGLPLVGNLLSLDPDLHTYFTRLAQSYGPIYSLKLGRKTAIVLSSPAMAKEILRDQDTTFANRDVPAAGKEATYGGMDIVWSPYGPQWQMLRRVCVREMLSGPTMDSVYALRRREIRETVRFLYSKRGSPVDFGEQMFLTVLNVITSMMWGETRESVGAEFKDVVGEMTALLGMPNLSDFYPALERLDLQGIRKRMKSVAKRLDKVFESVIEQRLKTGSGSEGVGSKDFLQLLLEMKDDGDSKTPFTMAHLKSLLMDMVVGGTDTTSTTMEFALAEMMNKPEVLTKVQRELDFVVGKGNTVEESDIKKLPYLNAVMKEAMRLHPALPLLVPHCPSKNCSVGGYTIPEGARVFVNVWAIHRDPSIWENPLEFCPERFLDYKGNDEFSYFPFGSGRRICAGIAMADRMFMFSLASLVHSFDWSMPVDGEKQLDLDEKFGIVLRKKTPLIAIPTPRLSDPRLYDQ